MAIFTTGAINLSQEHVFDSINMSSSDAMTFTGTGQSKIIVLGNMTVASGATITLRSGTNLTPGSVVYDGNTRVLNNNASLGGGSPGYGGSGGVVYYQNGSVHSYAGTGGSGGHLNNGGQAGSPPSYGGTNVGAGGTAPGGNGGNASSSSYPGGSGGGAGGAIGVSTERVHFLVYGNVTIAGTINGNGVNAISGGNGQGGTGGFAGSGYSAGAGGGGGGAGADGGHAGSIFIFHKGSVSLNAATENLQGGVLGSGGSGGGGGGANNGPSGSAGSAGSDGDVGNNGELEGISITMDTYMSSEFVSDITTTEFKYTASYYAGIGGAIADRGFVHRSGSSSPTINDTKVSVGSATGTFNGIISGLSEQQTRTIRSYTEFSDGPVIYGDSITTTTSANFKPQVIPITLTGDISAIGSVVLYKGSPVNYNESVVYFK